MNDKHPMQLTGNDIQKRPEDIARGNTSSAAAEKTDYFTNCGFRIAHDPAWRFEYSLGSKTFLSPEDARYLDKNGNAPGARRGVLGFRLARDEEGT